MRNPIIKKEHHHGKWQSRTPVYRHGYGDKYLPPPGNRIAMGCSTRHAKDIIQILKRAKKIINLMKASILLYFSPPSQLDCPQNDGFAISQRSSTTARSIESPLSCSGVNLVGCCVQSLIGGRLMPRLILFYLFFCPLTRRPKRCDSVLPHRDRPARRLPQLYPIA
jgi:hypothetical protein